MASPRIKKQRRQKRLHLIFGGHGQHDHFLARPIGKVDALLVEDPSGHLLRPIKESRAQKPDFFERDLNREIKKMRKSGTTVFVAESTKNAKKLERYRKAHEKTKKYERQFYSNPTLDNFKKGLKLELEFERLREQLIFETTQHALQTQGRTAARFGTAHSLLTAKLKRAGIDSSREISLPNAFTGMDWLVRRVLSGKRMSNRDVELGYLGEIIDVQGNLSESEKFVFEFELMHRMMHSKTRQPLLKLAKRLASQYTHGFVTRAMTQKILELNGLPKRPNRRQVIEWMKRKSFHWRRISTRS